MHQAGIRSQTPREIVDRLVAPDRFGQPFAAALSRRLFREFSFEVRLKRDAFRVHLLQVARDFRRVDTGIEIRQVPFRRPSDFGFGGGWFGAWFAWSSRLAESG